MIIDNLCRAPTRPVLLSVWLNFVENGKHGCAKACPFCNFRKNPVYMCPTEEDLREFLDTYEQYAQRRTLLLTGGGDPLYNFEKNRDKILMILHVCEEMNIDVVMQSGELDIINSYYDSLFKNVVAYYFSCEVTDDKVRLLAKKLRDAGKRVVVSKVLNISKDINAINYDALDKWVNFYKDYCSMLLIHENYNYCFTNIENEQLLSEIHQRYTIDGRRFVKYTPHRFTIDKFIGLMNNKVMWGQEFIFPK